MNCRTEFILDQSINAYLPAHKHEPTVPYPDVFSYRWIGMGAQKNKPKL